MKVSLKRVLSLVLVLCMVIGMAPAVFAEEAAFANQVGKYQEYDNSGNATGTMLGESFKSIEDGRVTLDKSIEQTGKDAFDITLTVSTKENLEVIKRARDAAIVIVMDVSGSMQFAMDGGGFCSAAGCSSYTNGKYYADAYGCCHGGWQSAWAVPGKLDQNGVDHGDTRFALMEDAVSAFLNDFADDSGVAKRMVSMVCYNDKVEKELGWVNVSGEAGMADAQAVVADGALAALTGGDTNTSLGLQRANEYLDQAAVAGIENTYVLLLTDGAPYTAIKYNADGSYTKAAGVGYDCDLTQAAADKLKAEHENAEVYTVCFGYQGKEWTATHSIVDGALTTTDKKFNIDDLMSNIASGSDHFFRGENVDAFELSLGSIVEETIASGAKLWTVTDPMGNYIEYVGLKADNPAASFGEGVLSWDLLNEKPVSVENGVYTYQLTYSVILKSGADGFTYGTRNLHPTNKATSLEYALINNNTLSEITSAYFNVPTVFAKKDIVLPPPIGLKSDERIDDATNRYLVEVEVPGVDGEKTHDEVIVMVDGSYSMDEEWEDMKKAIMLIGETVLNGSGTTQLTLMSFGISPNVVLEHVTSVEQLAATLPAKPGGLLYGRSATNCDGAFEGIESYIAEHDDTLKDAFVIYLSDGGVNLNSQPVDWIAVAGQLSAADALAVQKDEFNYVVLGNNTISEASKTVYGDNLETMLAQWKFVFDQEAVLGDLDAKMKALDPASPEYAAVKAEFDAALAASNEAAKYVQDLWNTVGEDGKTNAQKWVVEVYKDFYAAAGLTEGEAYPVYVAEYAYVDYQKANNLRLNNTFYYVLGLSGIAHDNVNGVKGYYAGQQAAVTAQNAGIETMYIVRYGYDHRSGWMTNVPNTEFIQSENVASLCDVLAASLTDLAKTPFNDVVVTDYMSKWVNLVDGTLRVIDNRTGETVWSQAEGWLVDERPTAKEVPVVVELIDESGYEAGGADVVGNTSGDIYKLTWYVKDGALLRADTYSLQYEVTVDTTETGFQYDYNYPANGNTDLHYTDENGDEHSDPIKVPDVFARTMNFRVSFPAGGASHICYLFVDKATGEVIYDYKIDFGGKDTTADPIQVKAGYVSVVFIKQAQSGMIWTSEDVSEDTMDNIVAAVKKYDKAYKGHDAEVVGTGVHELTYKIGNAKKGKTKTVFYTFE